MGVINTLFFSIYYTYDRKMVMSMERVNGIEPSSSGWKPEVIAIIRHPQSKE